MSVYINENFDGVTPPTLPTGWTSGGAATIVTESGTSYSGSQALKLRRLQRADGLHLSRRWPDRARVHRDVNQRAAWLPASTVSAIVAGGGNTINAFPSPGVFQLAYPLVWDSSYLPPGVVTWLWN